ncbi:MAG: transketolase, partial [Pseudomonadota bacterium]
LIVLWDDNGITIDGKVSIADQTDQRARFEACGWKTLEVDGHDFRAIDAAITFAKASAEPVLIACQTTIGKGAGAKAGSEKSHGSPLGETEIAIARQNLDWPYPPFDVPSDILSSWREAGQKGIATRKKWQETEETSEQKAQFRAQMNGLDQATVALTTNRHIASLIDEPVSIATRAASQKALEVLCPELPQLLGGSADLTGSNNTKTNDLGVFDVDNRQGRYIHYGIREHGMAAAMNGMALHGGVTPYGGTFLVFSDYCRPSIRLAALMGIQSIFVMTHDSIGLGEDGPTHQPVEHLAALRAIPNLNVFRPADSVETAECWAAALADTSRPSVIALARQKTPQIRRTSADENLCAKGGYVISDCSDYAATLVATGSEVHIAIEAAADLAGSGISVRVVSMPNWRAFTDQADTYRTATIGDKLVVAVEAGVRQGWDQYIGSTGKFVGMQSFGASAPAPALYEHFGITPKAIAEMVRNNL